MSDQQLEEFKELLWEFGNERYSDGQDDANRASNKTRLLSESYQELIELYDTALNNQDKR